MLPIFRAAAFAASSLTAIAALAACSSSSGTSSVPQALPGSQQQSIASQDSRPVPRYVVLHTAPFNAPPAGGLPLWSGSFKYGATTYSYTMVGANPATSNATTNIPAVIIPVKIVASGKTFDPQHVLPNGNSVVKNTTASPVLSSGIDFKEGGTDLGNTQYIDAFQRGNFWSKVKTHTNYHTLLTPTVLAEQTYNGGTVGSPFGFQVAEVDINSFDSFINGLISSLHISSGTFPIFLTYDTYLTSGGCCIGGYHNYNGSNTYSQATYIDHAGAFAQDVSALSHETGEWYDDPLTNNRVACGILEVGDPEEGFSNYGAFPYTLNGFTYNLQDLVWLPYFGAPPATSLHKQLSFQQNPFHLGICSQGG